MKADRYVKVLNAGRFVSLVSRKFEHNGVEGEWTYATRRKNGIGRNVNAVMIIPITRDREYVLNLQFRVPLVGSRESMQCREISFPAGMIDLDETPETAARRELKEETGYEVESVYQVSPPLANSAGITDEMVWIVRCMVTGPGETARENSEDIETFLARDVNDERIPKGKDIVWGAKTWIELYYAQMDRRLA